MKKFALLTSLLVAACTDAPSAKRSLEQAGYSDIQIGGYAAFSCSDKSDSFATQFTAKGPTGIPVSGAVCKGILKGSTIRLD